MNHQIRGYMNTVHITENDIIYIVSYAPKLLKMHLCHDTEDACINACITALQ